MTISQSSLKPTLEKESNFNQTIKMFEQNQVDSHHNHSPDKPLRKSLIPTIINQTQQKNYYSKYPFDKIVETTTTTTTQKTLHTNGKIKNQEHLPKAINEPSAGFNPQLEVKGEHKEQLRKSVFHRNLIEKNSSDSSHSSSDTKSKTTAVSNSTDVSNRLRIDTTPQPMSRPQQALSPPAITPRKQTSVSTPRQTFLPPAAQQSNYNSPPSLNNSVLKARGRNNQQQQTFNQRAQVLSPGSQASSQAYATKSPSPLPITTPRIKIKPNNNGHQMQQTQQLYYHQQFSSPQTLNNRQGQNLQIKGPFKAPSIHNKNTNNTNNMHEMREKQNESRLRESRLDNHNAYDLNSETILILPNKDQPKQQSDRHSNVTSLSMQSKLPVKKLKKAESLNSDNRRQTRSKLSGYQEVDPDDLTDSSLSSESFIVAKVEKTQSLFELISFLKIYLRKIENSYSLDELYAFLKTNVKFNGYSNFTIELLERFSKPKYTSCLGVYNDTNAPYEPQLEQSHKPPARSLSQLKPSPTTGPGNGRKSHKATKPVQKLLRNLSIFKTLFHIIQRDLVVNIFLLEIPKLSQCAQSNGRNSVMRSIELDANNIPIKTNEANISQRTTGTLPEVDLQNRLRLIQKIKRYHEILYDLNEKLSLLINDPRTCELKLLSQHSLLQSKYLYYKHGEFVLRITTDIIAKFKMILNISQSVYYLNYKLKENDFEPTTPRITGSLIAAEAVNEYDREINYYSVPEIEQRKQHQVLKELPRKRAQAFQKLPTLPKVQEPTKANGATETNLNKNTVLHPISTNTKPPKPKNSVELGPYTLKHYKKPALETLISLENNGNETNRNQAVVVLEPSPIEKEMQKENLKEKLLRLDSHDSFIRETDSSSITSENESVLAYIDDLEHENEMKNDQMLNQESLNGKTILPYTDSFQVQLDTNKLLEQHKVLTKQLEMSNQKYKELNFYLESLFERAERCQHLKMQLKSDQDLIRITENNLKEYNRPELNIKQRLQGKSSANRKQLEKQQDFLAYRFNLNLQDLTNEMAGAPQINYEIDETEKKIENLALILRDLNKYKFYVETKLSKHLLNIKL